MKKITMYTVHFAWIEDEMVVALDNALQLENKVSGNLANRTNWIKKECKSHLGIELKSKADIKKMDEILKKLLYSSKAEWLKERIRMKVNVNLRK